MKKSILLLTIFIITSNILAANAVRNLENNTGRQSLGAITYDSPEEIIKRLQMEMKHK